MALSEKLDKTLREYGEFLTKTTAMERAEHGSEGARWRVGKLAKDKIHGFAGGHYFSNLAEVSDYVDRLKERYEE
jgi:hypothetical protein